MDLSAVIFVAVAVAWAAYLVPKALRAHDEADRSRSVDRFSHTVRVLARRDAVSARDARLVVPQPARRSAGQAQPDEPADDSPAPVAAPAPPTPAQLRSRRTAAARATRRRRRVLGLLLTANVVVGTLVAFGVLALAWQAIPAGLLVAWLVACRVMVRGERAAWCDLTAPMTVPETPEAARAPEPRASEAKQEAQHESADDEDEADDAADADTSGHTRSSPPARRSGTPFR